MSDEFYDCTGEIGQLHAELDPEPKWPMYSFDRPAYLVWNTIAGELHKAGWSDEQIKGWLQSKSTRWALDMDLGEMLIKTCKEYARRMLEDSDHD